VVPFDNLPVHHYNNGMAQIDSNYSLLDHTADLGIRTWGADLKKLFENAGMALMDLLIRGVSPKRALSKKMSLTGDDLADLMVRWLGEILYLLDCETRVVTSIRIVDIRPSCLEAALKTVPFDPELHEILNEIKAVTYHQIEVSEKGNRWEAQVIFDL
jgi:SHS2 domain-containing protein